MATPEKITEMRLSVLEKVKAAMGQTGDSADVAISVYIDDVLQFMLNAGVSESIAVSSAGTITRGVSDLWDNDGGNVRFSPSFHEKVAQLVIQTQSEGDSS